MDDADQGMEASAAAIRDCVRRQNAVTLNDEQAIYTENLRPSFQVSLSLWGRPILFLKDWVPRASLFQETLQALSRHRAGAKGALSSIALSSCATDRLSTRDGVEINHRVQSAPRSLSARCETFDNQQGKDIKAKQHWCPLKQDHPIIVSFDQRPKQTDKRLSRRTMRCCRKLTD